MIAALLLAVLLLLAAPASADEPAWTIGGPSSTGAPKYTTPIHVVDAFIGTVNEPHRDEWRRARNQALAQWDLPFTVERMNEGALPYPYDENIGTNGIDGMVIPDAILIVRNRNDCSMQGGYAAAPNGGIVILCRHPFPGWWETQHSQIRAVAAHEIGHALGFGHGGVGVMGGNDHVNDQERAIAHAYYEEA